MLGWRSASICLVFKLLGPREASLGCLATIGGQHVVSVCLFILRVVMGTTEGCATVSGAAVPSSSSYRMSGAGGSRATDEPAHLVALPRGIILSNKLRDRQDA